MIYDKYSRMNGDKEKKRMASNSGARRDANDGGDISGGTSSDFHSDDDYAWIPWYV